MVIAAEPGESTRPERRLAAILAADVVGYTRLVERDEEGKLPFRFDALGERAVKNIARPIRVFRVGWEGGPAGAPPVQEPPALPSKPSIAVLPFTNMSRDADQEYFADGLVEDLITDLSK